MMSEASAVSSNIYLTDLENVKQFHSTYCFIRYLFINSGAKVVPGLNKVVPFLLRNNVCFIKNKS